MSVEASSDLEELFRLNVTFDIPKGLFIETRNISDRARRVRQAIAVTRWRNTTCLGQGASGVVWLQQEDEAPEKCRAIKQIPKGTRSAPLAVDYRRELLALGRLSKREDLFVRFLGWYEDTRSVYLAMEYFEQGDLGRHLSAPLAEDEVKVISRQILEGLAVLHGQNWAHRDLKPPNIFVVDTSPWWVKIGDFGISKRIRSGNTRFQTMIGTPDFVAPEVLNLVSEANDEDTGDEEDEYTVAVDMWSLGCVIFQLLTLETPFANRKKLGSYCRSKLEKFPIVPLRKAAISDAATGVIKEFLEPIPSHRTTAHAALQCEWIQEVRGQASSDNDSGLHKVGEEIAGNIKARKDSSAVADAAISSGARKAQTAGLNEGFHSGSGVTETLDSDMVKTSRHDLEPQEQVQNNSSELGSDKPKKPGILDLLYKPQSPRPPSPPETNPDSKKELELNDSVLRSFGGGLGPLAGFVQLQRSMSRNATPAQRMLPASSSSCSSKPPSLHESSPREAELNSPAEPNLKRHSPWGHRAAGEPLKDARRSDDASNDRNIKAALSPELTKPRISRGSDDPLSTNLFSVDEQVDNPSLVGAFENLSTAEQRPKAGIPRSTARRKRFNIKPVFDFSKSRQPMTKQVKPQEKAQEANGSLSSVFVFGLENQQGVYGPKQDQTESTLNAPGITVPLESFENPSHRYVKQESELLQSKGTRKALLISINHYVRNGQLKTNIRDINATADYLVHTLHYGKKDVSVLTRNHCSASKKDVIGAMTWFIDETKAGDTRFLHFSGKPVDVASPSSILY